MKLRWLAGMVVALAACRVVAAQEVTVDTAPPVVVKTVPEAGSKDVAPTIKEIRVTFSKAMIDGSWSVSQATARSFPKLDGKIHYDRDEKTCVIPVKLEPGRTYALWLNSERFRNFKDREGRSSLPYLLVFRTKATLVGQAETPRADFTAAYDALLADMAVHYSYFDLKKVNPQTFGREARAQVAAARSTEDFVAVLRPMLAVLRDGHVWVEVDGDRLPTYRFPRTDSNRNTDVTLASLESPQVCGAFARVGLVKGDGFGAIVLMNQSAADAASVDRVVAFIKAHADAPGFLVDLRWANGGDERLARRVAQCFCARDTVYALSKFRDGPKPGEFGPVHPRTLPASEQPYSGPVVCLIGPGCVSSGEGFAKMLAALPSVTTLGAPTRGSSGNPSPFKLPGVDVSVWYSRWVDMLPDGTPIEGRGVLPQVAVNDPPASYNDHDPTWQKALELLRHKVRKAS